MSVRQRLVIAGGLGTGKSTVGQLLIELGWSVLDTDHVGHEVLLDEAIIERIAVDWPEVVIDGSVDRSRLAQQVFSHLEELRRLEAIVHPAITDRVQAWLEGGPRRAAIELSVLKVLRPEWGKVVVVHAPEQLRLGRAAARGMDRGDARRRIRAQVTDLEMLSRADLVIDNSGQSRSLQDSVARLDLQFP